MEGRLIYQKPYRIFLTMGHCAHGVGCLPPREQWDGERTVSSIKSNLVKIRMDGQLSVVSFLGIAFAAIRMVPSHTKRVFAFQVTV